MARKRLQYPSISRVIRIPVPYPVVIGGNFAEWEVVLKSKHNQPRNFTPVVRVPTADPVTVAATGFQDWPNLVFPRTKPQQVGFISTPAVLVDTGQLGGDFEDFGLPTRSKPIQFGFTSFIGDSGPAQTPPWFVFSTFSQPQVVKPVQQDFLDTPQVSVTPIVQTYLFSEFSQPKVISKVFQENTFNDYEAVANYFFPVFADFEPPRFKQTIQDQSVQFTIFPTTQVVVAQPYVFGQFSQPQLARVPQAGFTNTVQPVSVQTYVFSTFSQPLIKKQVNDQPTWFIGTVVSQPYVFSAFSQPQPIRRTDTPYVQTSYYPVVFVPPPVFTGFNDFGLAQQLVGTQQKQDGGYVQFTVLPMPQVISPYFFTGFSDFATMLLTKSAGLIGLNTDQPNVVLQPIIPPPFPTVGPGGTKRWKEGYEQLRKGTAPLPIPIVSSNLSSVVYDEDSKELTVEFKTYKYEKVPAKKVRGLLSAGGYFQQNIKGKYPTTRIK